MPSSHADQPTTWVAISGGVDSAVAAALLLDDGVPIVGATMRLVPEGVSPSHERTIVAAEEVCETLGIEHRLFDLSDEFTTVVESSRRARVSGRTPNPCVHCNEILKFGTFHDEVLRAGASTLATGHYVTKVAGSDGTLRLARGVDRTKDQSYFLYRLAPAILESCVFPLGTRTKEWVTSEAVSRQLPVLADESQDLCVPEPFDQPVPSKPGNIVDRGGAVLGGHNGIDRFTVGQRKGIGLGGGDPLFVLDIDAKTGTVTVGPRDLLDRRHVRARKPVWYAADQVRCHAAVRYRSAPAPATARIAEESLIVEFDTPADAPAPGQSVVCYVDDVVVGGGIIEAAW